MALNNKNNLTNLKKGIDCISVTCVTFCHNGHGKLLLHKRSENCRDEVNRWDCLGGAMEYGETFNQTISREMKEEYCVTPIDIKYCGTINVIRTNNGTKSHWIAVIFAAKVNPIKVRNGEPHKISQMGWFAVNKLPRPLHSMLKKHLMTVQKAGVKI